MTAIAVAIGLPSAWLVTRTDLPGRRVWAVVLALPLVVPSYVIALALIAVSGPGGLLGVPAIDGFDGSVAALALATYPYVFLLCGGGAAALGPVAGGGRAVARRVARGASSGGSRCRRCARRWRPARCSSRSTRCPTSASCR